MSLEMQRNEGSSILVQAVYDDVTNHWCCLVAQRMLSANGL